jgi:hypothetical protein
MIFLVIQVFFLLSSSLWFDLFSVSLILFFSFCQSVPSQKSQPSSSTSPSCSSASSSPSYSSSSSAPSASPLIDYLIAYPQADSSAVLIWAEQLGFGDIVSDLLASYPETMALCR